MTNVPTEYSIRFVLPDLLERGRANTLRCPVIRSGAVVPVASGTITILDQGSTEQVSAAAVTISGGVATYSYSPASTLPYGEGWEVRWDLLLENGARVQATNEAALVRARLNCPVSDFDLYQRVSGLDPSGSVKPIHSQASFQDQIDLAWQRIERRLIEKGNRPNLVSSPASFFDAALNLTLALIFENFSTRLNSAYMDQGKMFRAQYENAWKELRFTYATTDDIKGASGRRRPAEPFLFAASRR